MANFTYAAVIRGESAPGIGFLDGASDRQWSQFKSFCETRHHANGSTIVKAGEQDRSLWMVVGGALDVTVPGPPPTRHRVGSGTVIGEVAFFDGQPRSADIAASGDVELLVLTYANFERLAAADPALAQLLLLDLGRFLAQRLRASEAG
ncbi:MAG TPA: cyclic nucleotide-binding domain-containing protein [Sporichthyaceae bacterium]|nr:cyclic nucleotide-binding domain-containing protein [Sporichthyaceae bacterium]